MRRIAVVTGTRADYGIYRSVLEAMQAEPSLEPGLIVTGMHLSTQYGLTVNEIRKDGFPIWAEAGMLEDGDDTGDGMAKAVGRAILGITDALKACHPEVLLLLGDRGEMLAGAIAGAHMNISVAHMHGGEVSGTVDESIRHAITKLAHIHLPSTEESARRLEKMGERNETIFVVGAAGLDKIVQAGYPPHEEVCRQLGLDPVKPIIICAQHPITTEIEEAGMQMAETLKALQGLKHQTVLICPNSDAGNQQMIAVIRKYDREPWLKVFTSLRHELYLGLMRSAAVMVGNSSSGIIEAPSFGLPVVNVGTRQSGRQQGNNVINVGYDCGEISAAVTKAITDEKFLKKVRRSPNPYGDGCTGQKIAGVLAGLSIDLSLLQKRLTY